MGVFYGITYNGFNMIMVKSGQIYDIGVRRNMMEKWWKMGYRIIFLVMFQKMY